MLGWMIEVGRGVPKDSGESVRWYVLAAAQGNAFDRERLKNIEALRKITIPSPKKKSPPN